MISSTVCKTASRDKSSNSTDPEQAKIFSPSGRVSSSIARGEVAAIAGNSVVCVDGARPSEGSIQAFNAAKNKTT